MRLLIALSLISAFRFTACSSDSKKSEAPVTAAVPATMSPEEVQRATASWQESHKQIIQELTAKYGQPNESTPDQVIWNNNGPWLKTVVNKNDITTPLQQTAKLNVPADKKGDVALFNTSVIVDPTVGLVTSSANKEDLNFLSLNLTKEIINGNMSPMEARRQYTQVYSEESGGESAPETIEAEEQKIP